MKDNQDGKHCFEFKVKESPSTNPLTYSRQLYDLSHTLCFVTLLTLVIWPPCNQHVPFSIRPHVQPLAPLIHFHQCLLIKLVTCHWHGGWQTHDIPFWLCHKQYLLKTFIFDHVWSQLWPFVPLTCALYQQDFCLILPSFVTCCLLIPTLSTMPNAISNQCTYIWITNINHTF